MDYEGWIMMDGLGGMDYEGWIMRDGDMKDGL